MNNALHSMTLFIEICFKNFFFIYSTISYTPVFVSVTTKATTNNRFSDSRLVQVEIIVHWEMEEL